MSADRVALARAALEQMVSLAEAPKNWWMKGHWYTARITLDDPADGAFMAAASPDLLFRLATEALAVLDRHGVYHDGERIRSCLCGERLPCPEVQAVIRAWTP